MKYDPIREERKVWEALESGRGGRHHFPLYNYVRSKLCDTLVELGCDNTSSVLAGGWGSGEDAIYLQAGLKNIISVDLCSIPLKRVKANGFQCILADVKKLPFYSD